MTSDHAEIERLRAELKLEREAAAAREAATGEILAAIDATSADPTAVLNRVLEAAGRLCGAEAGSIGLVEGANLRSVAMFGREPLPVAVGHSAPPAQMYYGAAPRAVLTGRTSQVDYYNDPDVPEASRLILRERHHHFSAAAPLIKNGLVTGTLSLARYGDDAERFSDRQLELLAGFAAQARIAVENARLFNELEQRNNDLAESLEQQTATSEILSLISRSPTDPRPVFQAIAASARRLSNADGVDVFLLDIVDGNGLQTLVASAGSSLGTNRALPEVNQPFPVTAISRKLLEGQPVHLFGTPDDIAAAHPLLAEGWRRVGFTRRSVLMLPLVAAGNVLGMIGVGRSGGVPFADPLIAVLKSFADQVVIAIENARLFHELEQRNRELAESLEQQTATAEVLQIISRSSFEPQTVLDAVVTRAARLAEGDDAYVALLDEEGVGIVASWDIGMLQTDGQLAIPRRADMALIKGSNLHESIVTRRTVALHGGPAAIADSYPVTAEIWRVNGIGSAVIVPLVEGLRTLGALAVRRVSQAAFTPRQLAVLEGFANQAVVAMENARLFEEIQDKTRQLEGANHQLEEANAAKSQFLSAMSHELRTPLNAVIGYSELLREEAEDEGLAGMVPDLVRINAAGKHLLSLINNVLDLSKIEAGKMELELQDFGVGEVLAEVEAVVPPLMSRNGNRFVLDTAADLESAHTDKTKLRQCLLNLLSNAAKFTEQGTVTLTVRRTIDEAGNRLTFAVSDTGIGMSEEQLGRLFQSFTQAEAGTASRYGGTGLGLSLSREFARLMGGDITVESEQGKGSTFTLKLPAQLRVPAATSPPALLVARDP